MILSSCARPSVPNPQHRKQCYELSLVTRLIIGVLVNEDLSLEGPFHLRAILELC